MAWLRQELAGVFISSTLLLAQDGNHFALRNGQIVIFYGDSITEQREYTQDVENYVLTRFPEIQVTFHNAGVGGDKVSGGWAGPVDLRLARDLYLAHPDMITIMLGMNDGYYRTGQPGIVSTYSDGYRHIVESIQTNLPKAEITIIQPSPYDDITRDPQFPGGYNAVLLEDGELLEGLSSEKHTRIVDFNAPMTEFLTRIKKESPNIAQQVIPDRIHPGPGGHWVMATSLLRSWGASSLVSSVTLDVRNNNVVEADNAHVTELKREKSGITWMETENALPLPLPSGGVDPVLDEVVRLSDLVSALDQENLKVIGLANGNYSLLIDERVVGTFSNDELNQGINLALLDTPMREQSIVVAFDTERKDSLELARFSIINDSAASEASKTAEALVHTLLSAVARQHQDARPRPHAYTLVTAAK